jgi:hypothetical protein
MQFIMKKETVSGDAAGLFGRPEADPVVVVAAGADPARVARSFICSGVSVSGSVRGGLAGSDGAAGLGSVRVATGGVVGFASTGFVSTGLVFATGAGVEGPAGIVGVAAPAGAGATGFVSAVACRLDVAATVEGLNDRMNAAISSGWSFDRASLSFTGFMPCPLPSTIDRIRSASVRLRCHLGSVKSGICAIPGSVLLRPTAPLPSVSWQVWQTNA